ncbi:MAG: threonine synthase [Gemmatimonadota bacterium]
MITHLECARCQSRLPHEEVQQLCRCGAPLFARYDLAAAAVTLTREALRRRPPNLWRYRELLPLRSDQPGLTLGEGATPLLRARRLGAALRLPRLLIKDESCNPTGSFKARGMAVALAKARALGVRTVALPTAGNAGGAAAAYAAVAGLEAHVFMPEGTPLAFEAEARSVGAAVTRAGRSIAEAARRLAPSAMAGRWYDLSTFKEPYRVEGKKTMGFELFEALGRLPEAVVYPAGGGTGLVGLWKAFDELEGLGWIGGGRPRMYAVQAAGCAPLVEAFEAGRESARPVTDPVTRALGLRVPHSRADFLILNILRASGGAAVAVSEEAIGHGERLLGREGLFASPESGAAAAGLALLVAREAILPDDTVVLFHTAGGAKYVGADAAGRGSAAMGPTGGAAA